MEIHMKTYSLKEVEYSKIETLDFVVYDTSKYNSVLEAIIKKDIIKNEITVSNEDCYYVYDYEHGISNMLNQLNPNLKFVWQYFGLDTYELLHLDINEKKYDTERELTPEILLLAALSTLLNDVDGVISTPEGLISNEELDAKYLPMIMKHELSGNATVKGLSIRKWLEIMKEESSDLIKHTVSEKIGLF
jgi:hypothetical protein